MRKRIEHFFRTNDAGTNVTISQLQTANVIDQREETDDEFRLDRTPRPIRSNRRSAIPQRMSLGAHHPNITNQPPLEQSWPNDEVRSDPSQFPFLSRNIRPRPTVSNGGALNLQFQIFDTYISLQNILISLLQSVM